MDPIRRSASSTVIDDGRWSLTGSAALCLVSGTGPAPMVLSDYT